MRILEPLVVFLAASIGCGTSARDFAGTYDAVAGEFSTKVIKNDKTETEFEIRCSGAEPVVTHGGQPAADKALTTVEKSWCKNLASSSVDIQAGESGDVLFADPANPRPPIHLKVGRGRASGVDEIVANMAREQATAPAGDKLELVPPTVMELALGADKNTVIFRGRTETRGVLSGDAVDATIAMSYTLRRR